MLTSSTTTVDDASAYATLQRAMVARMQEMRERVQAMDALDTHAVAAATTNAATAANATTTMTLAAVAQRHATLLAQLREASAALRQQMRDAARLATSEQRMHDLPALTRHYEHTQQLVRSRCARALGAGASVFALDDDDDDDDHAPRATATTHASSSCSSSHDDADDHTTQRYDARADVEFMHFVAQTRERDADMDAAADRIYHGVKRLGEQARTIQSELQTQSTLLDQAESGVLRNHEQVDAVNSRVRTAVRRLGKSKLITYGVCCAILVVLVIVIVFLAKSL